MVRISLDACISNIKSPTDIFQDAQKRRLLLKKGAPLSDKAKDLLKKNKIGFLEFPLPFEETSPPPYTFSEETETALFCLARDTFLAFKENAISNPFDIRKASYEILSQAAEEFQHYFRLEEPMGDAEPKRHPASILHLRTIGSIDDYLYEHAKNVSLLSAVLSFDYFKDSKQRLADLHKVAVAGLFADIGMMKIPKRIRQKQEELTEEEWEKIHQHPEMSAEFTASLFRQSNFITSTVVRQHHERLNGKGYPNQVNAFKLTPYSHLLAVADSYISMVSKRYFRPAHNPLEAMLSLNEMAGKEYEKNAIRCLNYRVAPYPVGSIANFAGKKLVQVIDLKNIPIGIEVVPVYTPKMKKQLYNLPNHIRAFTPESMENSKKAVPIEGHLDKMGIPLDTFDLLHLYGYTNNH